MDKMREEFSVHCQLWRYSEYIDEDGFFINPVTQRAWNAWQSAWQASRKALVVELPTTWDASYTDKAIVMDASSVVEALEDAGISYK